jgi:phosphoribosylformimino-5-aminoimidazole carboxamide ribotide isomerase
MEIIPAIDIMDGQCVRLTHGDFHTKLIYHTDPLDAALQFEQLGVQRLHLVDLDGARAGAVKNWQVLERIAKQTSLWIDFGGGVKTKEDVDKIIAAGAQWVTVGSIAVKAPAVFEKWLQQYGPERFLLGADVRNERITISGWQETTEEDILTFIGHYFSLGVRQLFCTDVSKDGALSGPAFELYEKIISHFPELFLIASGGVSSREDVLQLSKIGCKGVIIGKALYEGHIDLSQIL